jgi:hypothetical protein
VNEPRGRQWLEDERQRLLQSDREELIDFLIWVDPEGAWTDEDMAEEGLPPMSVEDAVDHAMDFVALNNESPEEMVYKSHKASNGRYEQPKGAKPKYSALKDTNKPTVGHSAMKPTGDRPR